MKRKLCIILVNMVGIAALLFATEKYLKSQNPIDHVVIDPPYRLDEELRLSGKPGAKGRIVKSLHGQIIFDTEIEFDSFGFRKTEPAHPNSTNCIYIVGGSLAFGLGVQQNETLASYLQKKLGQRARVINLGFEGYGPHHLLRMLELGREKATAKNCQRGKAYNLGITEQIKWTAGRGEWLVLSPRYVLQNGRAAYDGKFRNWLVEQVPLGPKPQITVTLQNYSMDSNRAIDENELATYHAIMREIREIFRARLSSDFTNVIFTSGEIYKPNKTYETPGIPTIYFEQIAKRTVPVPDLKKTFYHEDFHLKAKAYEFLADHLLKEIEPWLKQP